MDEFRVDAHTKVLDKSVVERAKRRDLDAVVYAPHFRRLPDIRARAERFSDEELLVVPVNTSRPGTTSRSPSENRSARARMSGNRLKCGA